MAKKRKYEDAATWKQRVDAWRSSGLSVTQFADREGLARSTWLKWRRALGAGQPCHQLESVAANAQAHAVYSLDRQQLQAKQGGSAGAVTFIELPVPVESRGTVGYGVPFEVWLRSGRRLQVPAAFDADALERLIAILEGR